MPLKILCAGYDKDEKFELERRVRSFFGPPLADESWTISLVRLGNRISVSVDGPDERLRGKSFLAGLPTLRDAFSDLLSKHGFELPTPVPEAPPAAKPAPAKAPARPLSPKPAPVHPRPAVTQARPHRPPPSRSVPVPKASVGLESRGRAKPVAPAAPANKLEPGPKPLATVTARDTHQCPSCGGGFSVVYEFLPDEPRQFVAVACPHCWTLDRVEVGQTAALEQGYRADKLT